MGIVAGNLKASLRKKAAGLRVASTHQFWVQEVCGHVHQ